MARKTLLSLLNKYYHHSDIQACYMILDEYEKKPMVVKIADQKERLIKLLTVAAYEVPYYQDLFREMGIEKYDDRLLENFSRIPLLSKQLIRENFNRLKKRNINDYRWFLNTTGGSTGEPLSFLQDWNFLDFSLAMKQIQFKWAGEKENDTHIKLWGSQQDILQGGIGLKARLSNWLHKTILLNSFYMTPIDMKNYSDIIQRTSSVFIEAYADSAYELARYINQHSISIFNVTSVITSAGTLFPFMRAEIEKAFRCKVFNRYGSREMGDMACERDAGKGLHVSNYTHLIEIINEKGAPCVPGEEGEIVITCLTNYVYPFVRYKTGDRGIVGSVFNDQLNSCGVLEDVSGRVTDSFVRRDGTIISSEFFIHFLGVVFNSGWLKKVQIVQDDYELLIIKMVTSFSPPASELESIKTSIKKVMGEKCDVRFDVVDEIPKLPSGKHQYTKTLVGRVV